MNQRTYPQGVPSWVDTEQPDVEAAIDFYGGLFGWTFEYVMPPGAPGRYLIAKLDGLDVAGLGSGGEGTAWNTYIAVDDADDAVSKLVTAGAKVVSTPEDAGEGGRSAALADPEGAGFRLWQAKRRLGAQVVNQPGAWNFSDLHTPDPGESIAFYEKAFGWQVDDVGFGLMVRRPGYGNHLEATTDPDIRARQSGISATRLRRRHRLDCHHCSRRSAALARYLHGCRPRPDRGRRRAARRRDPGAGRHRVDPRSTDPGPAGSGLQRKPIHASHRLSG